MVDRGGNDKVRRFHVYIVLFFLSINILGELYVDPFSLLVAMNSYKVLFFILRMIDRSIVSKGFKI